MTIAAAQTSVRYQPLAQIGRGGMAEVILAEMQLGPGVTSLAVLKRLWPELADDPDFVALFLREGRLCARLNHPNVVRTFEIIDGAAGAAIAMEYLDGQPLARVLNRLMGAEALSLPARLRVLVDVLAALAYAHDLRGHDGVVQGIVHRDVNPQNVFVTYEGMVKLLDFGVAKSATDAYQTRPGELRGKLAYLAPEQALGEVVDRRADVFSVGVMLWEMVTGRRLWQSMTESSIMRQLCAGRIPPLPRDAAVPLGLADVCAGALAPKPERRFATAGEFAAELQRLLPATEDANSRNLGRVVALAFAPERAARRTLIEEHLRRARGAARDAAVGRTGGAAPPALPELRPDRATPGGMWSLGAQELAGVIELDPSEVVIAGEAHALPPPREPRRPAAVTLPTSSVKRRSIAASLTIPRLVWMAAGFAAAVAVGGAVFAGRWAGSRAANAAHTVSVPSDNAASPPVVVRSTIVPIDGVTAAPTCNAQEPRACVATPPAAEPAVAAAPDAPSTSESTAAVGGWAAPRLRESPRRPRGRAGADAEKPREGNRSDGHWRRGEAAAPAARSANTDDDTLEPTIDLSSVPAAGVAGPALAPTESASFPKVPTRADSAGDGPAPARRRAVRAIDVADPFAP